MKSPTAVPLFSSRVSWWGEVYHSWSCIALFGMTYPHDSQKTLVCFLCAKTLGPWEMSSVKSCRDGVRDYCLIYSLHPAPKGY